MVTFLIALAALLIGFFVYGKIIDNFFKPTDAPTPAVRKNDGVDFVPLPTWKVFLIQLLNIAGLGPIFGALAGALWGPCVYFWIVGGTIFAGGVHDYLSGMISLREDGKSLSEIVGEYLGERILMVMRIFLLVLLILVGTVFTVGPAGLLKMLTGVNLTVLLLIILAYYFLATLLPIDALIGRLYPIFGICFIIMALGVMGGMLFSASANMPEMVLANLNPKGDELPIWPLMFITVACGAVSGFHATQSPMMARCLKSEKLARPVFYGAMVSEGIIALIWAAAGITFFHGTGGLGEALAANGPGGVVHQITIGFMGSGVGMVLAMIGVIVCPITSGDTALRSARLILADWFKMPQDAMKNRLMLALPLIIIAGVITQMDFNALWRYFAWVNQSIATIMLWTGAVYMVQKLEGKAFFAALIPAVFMTAVTVTYILHAPEGLQLPLTLSTSVGLACAAICLIQFWRNRNQFGISAGLHTH
ncbi:MAG: carbon starvation protein A [Selenomonadaceae bacterium]|nr:carbon starvation protein A [Selenomonadaceae bacterium]